MPGEEELGIENILRAARGEPLLKSIDELDGKDTDEADAADAAADAAEPEQKDPAKDALLAESGRILLDAIRLNHRVAASAN